VSSDSTGRIPPAFQRQAPKISFSDFPADCFPFTIELLDAGTREVVWSAKIDGPGMIRVPGSAELGPGPRIARIRFADGTVVEQDGNET
jgi:hypothetical protein